MNWDTWGKLGHRVELLFNPETILLSDGVERDTGGESGHRLKMSLKPRENFLAYVPIHLQCPDPPHLMVLSCPNSPWVSQSTPVDDTISSQ